MAAVYPSSLTWLTSAPRRGSSMAVAASNRPCSQAAHSSSGSTGKFSALTVRTPLVEKRRGGGDTRGDGLSAQGLPPHLLAGPIGNIVGARKVCVCVWLCVGRGGEQWNWRYNVNTTSLVTGSTIAMSMGDEWDDGWGPRVDQV